MGMGMGTVVTRTAPSRLAFLGTRGIPARYGGFETFAAELSPILAQEHGFSVLVVGDRDHPSAGTEREGQLQLAWSCWSKSGNPLRYYRDSFRLAAEWGADLALVCGTPGGALALSARRRMVVVTNPDGLESRRAKWSWPVRLLFLGTEFGSARFSHALACDSRAIQEYYRKRYRVRRSFVAEYGARPNPFLGGKCADLTDRLRREGLTRDGYFLVVARLEPENQVHDLVEGYRLLGKPEFPLVVVSNLPSSRYAQRLVANPPPGARFLGTVFDSDRLLALRAGARAYLHGHRVGGTNPSLLEAMASGPPCICSDNVFNRETTAGAALFFRDAKEVSERLGRALQGEDSFRELGRRALDRWRAHYTWDRIAGKYAEAFRELLRQRGTA